jgi:hypothetical protein
VKILTCPSWHLVSPHWNPVLPEATGPTLGKIITSLSICWKPSELSIRYNLISTCAGECDWLFHWQHKLCAIFSANVNINYRLPIKVYCRICTLRHIRIEINHGSQNVFSVLTWIGDINKFYPSLLARDKILISANPW